MNTDTQLVYKLVYYPPEEAWRKVLFAYALIVGAIVIAYVITR